MLIYFLGKLMRKPTNRLNLIDDRLFRVAAKDKSFCEELCRVIYNDEKLTVLENEVQWDGHNLYGKSVMLDLKCVLGDGTFVNVEIQKSDNENHQKRIRCNSSVLTTNYYGSRCRLWKCTGCTRCFYIKVWPI